MNVINAVLAAFLLLLLGDFVATFFYHVPEHVFGKFHSIVHHSPHRSFIRYAVRTRQPVALIDGFLSAFPYLMFIPALWFLSPWGSAIGLILAECHVLWRHQFAPQYRTPRWLQVACRYCGITTPERHWIHHQYANKAFGDIFSFYGRPAELWLKWLRWTKQRMRARA